MSRVLFLNLPAYGHVNPTLGLVDELVKYGEEVIYFSSEEFKEKIENSGASFKSYDEESYTLKHKHDTSENVTINDWLELMNKVLLTSEEIIEDILEKINCIKFDYIIYGAAFPFGNIISQILKIPAIASFAVFGDPKELMSYYLPSNGDELIRNSSVMETYKKVKNKLKEMYNVEMPEMMKLFFNKGDLNIVYTSKEFISHIEYYDDSYIFIGPPIYDRKESIDFPFEKLKDKRVVYISLGTVFNDTNDKLYDIFFETFDSYDGVIVMAAYNKNMSKFKIPKNFIVRNYVPQSEILKYTDVAITHAGMNSTNDLLYNNVPFVAIPIGSDQPYMARRVSELGAAISLDKDKLTPGILRDSVEKVLTDKSYLENIKKISNSFKETGGYKRAVNEILKFKNEKGIY